MEGEIERRSCQGQLHITNFKNISEISYENIRLGMNNGILTGFCRLSAPEISKKSTWRINNRGPGDISHRFVALTDQSWLRLGHRNI